MAGQLNIAKGYGQTIPPNGMRGYGFDIEGNPVVIKEDGSIELIYGGGGGVSSSLLNLIANRGVGLYANIPLDPVNNDIYVASDTNISYVYSDSILDWVANILVKNQFITDTSLADKTLYQYDGSQLVQLIFPPDEITGDEIVDLLEALTADNRLDASAIKNLPTEAAVGGFASNVYFSALDSDLVGYKKQSATVDTLETILTPTVKSSDGNKLVNQYVFDLPANINLIQQGNWSFTFASFVSSATGDTRLGFRPFRYTALGEKIYTFTDIVWSDELNQLVREYKTANLIQESKAIELTDRLGCDLYIKTSSPTTITVNIVIGDGQALFMNVPIALRHSALRDLNGDPNYQHIILSQKDALTSATSPSSTNPFQTLSSLPVFEFQFNTLTSDSDAGSGYFWLNNATQSSATIAYFSDTQYNAGGFASIIQSMGNGGKIMISVIGNRSKYVIYTVTSITDATGYTKVGLTIDQKGTDFASNDVIGMQLVGSGVPTDLAQVAYDGLYTSLTNKIQEIEYVCSDEESQITTGTNKIRDRIPYNCTIIGARIHTNTAPAGSAIIVDFNLDGTSIFSVRISIDIGETTSETAATPYVLSTTSATSNQQLSVDFDQTGTTIGSAGTGLKFILYVIRT